MDPVLIGVACVALLLVVGAIALCRAGGLADRMADRALGRQHQNAPSASDAFASWDEPVVDVAWPEERAA